VTSTVNNQVGANGDAERVAKKLLEPVVEQVRPGVWSVPVSWPRSALRYTLAYLLSVGDGAVLVDTGWPTDAGWESLVAGVKQTGHSITDITDVLVTHSHPDHLGLAAKVREVSGARIGMHPAEAEHVSRLARPGARERTARWLRARGAPAAETAEIIERSIAGVAFYGEQAAPDVLIDDGSLPVRGLGLRAIWTPGHSPGHLCFYETERRLLLTGDHVLPRISPHIGLNDDDDDPDPLGRYLASLGGLQACAPDEVLPAHERRLTGLGDRVAELLAHHRARLAEIEHAVACLPGASTWRVAELLTWSRGWQQTTGMTRRAAVSETLAHLAHLQGQQRVVNAGLDEAGGRDAVDAWLPGPRAGAEWN
jgi:glyoxylase-like metal-dependent hydrolase (beta-lactamase superfamily II)